MLSILIPVYNYNVFPLVEQLHHQLIKNNIAFEIICMDDASTEHYTSNSNILNFNNCYYFSLKENIGRSKIRNQLANKASYPWLLFLDADVMPVSSDFIKNYVGFIEKSPKSNVVCGGISYSDSNPPKEKLLRWILGKKKEAVSLKVRSNNPYRYFFVSNCMIKKELFLKIKFDETIKSYGYEDILFAKNLKEQSVKINHIDNSVFHLGLDDNSTYIHKIEVSINTLKRLYKSGVFDKTDVVLLSKFHNLNVLKLTKLIGYVFSIFKKPILYNLQSRHPSVFLLNVYKLGYLCSLKD
ncbi:MAG: glycosyltransferase family A protein [Flavobacteriaceae bacterium]|jgi:glycosyltransferase involved in cell wall biosynthesis